MSINISNNNEYIRQGNFGATNFPVAETPQQADMLKSMSLPSNPSELVQFTPFALAALGFSKLVSSIATTIGRVNPFKNPNVTLEESFKKSPIANLSAKIDKAILPIQSKYAPQINFIKEKIQKTTPNWIKNIIEKIKIGVSPKSKFALTQYRGLTHNSADYFLGLLQKLPQEKIQELGIKEVLGNFAAKNIDAQNAVKQIAQKLKNVSAKDLQSIAYAPQKGIFSFLKSKNLRFVDELNKTKTFMATNAKTPISKLLQKGVLSVTESAGGGVIGGGFGIIMNSLFIASAFKRTWDAPWGEKFSTFMEAALVDFCGGYLMMLLGTRLTYKLLGIKNIDKSAAQINAIRETLQQVALKKQNHKNLQNLLKCVKSGNLNTEVVNAAASLGINMKNIKNATDLTNALESLKNTSASQINSTIDKLKSMQSFQGKGLDHIIKRPIRWIGNLFSVGLETLPSKVAEAGKVSSLKAGLQKLKNTLKGIAGYPIRFLLITMIITPPLTKLITKISHTLFGKPTNSVYDDKSSNKNSKKDVNNKQSIDIDSFAQYTKATGLARNYVEEQLRKSGQLPPKAQTQVPAEISPTLLNQVLSAQKQKLETNKTMMPTEISPATYIPSTIPTNFSDHAITNALNQKLNHSNAIENQINKELNIIKSGDLYNF